MEQVTKLLCIQTINIKPNAKNNTLGISKTYILLPLVFNFYLNSLDKFVEKIIKSATKTKKRELNPEYKKMTESNLSKFEIRLIKIKYRITKEKKAYK